MHFLSDPNFWIGLTVGAYSMVVVFLIAFIAGVWGVERKP